MSRWLLLSLFVPGVAGAVSPTWFARGAGDVEVAGPTEVALYTGHDGRTFAIGRFGEGDDVREIPVHFGLSGPNVVPEEVVGALGLKAKADGEVVTVPELRFGEVVLRDLRAKVGSEAVLNVGTLEGVAVAVLPSSGTLVIGPAAQADAVLGRVGTGATASIEGKAPWFFHGSKRAGDALSWEVEGLAFGTAGRFRLAPDEAGSTLGADLALGEATRIRAGEAYAWAPAQVGGVEIPALLFHQDQSLAGRDGGLLGRLGADALAAVDWAADPATLRFAAKSVTAAPVDPSEALIAIARADFARAEEEAKAGEAQEEAPAEPTEGPVEDAGAVGRHTALADALWTWGQRSEALEHYTAARDAAGERCGPYLTLGRRLLQDGQPEAALAPLQQAAAAWDRWYAQDLETRERVQAGKKVGDDVFSVEQSPTCHEAWGELAAARFALGSYDEVRAIARAHRDLDPLPWQLAGLAGLVEGNPTAANADLRQALQIGARQDAWTLLALAWSSADLERPDAVRAQIDALRSVPDLDLVAIQSASLLAREVLDAATTVEVMTALTNARPDSAPAFIGLAVAQQYAGTDATAAIATATALAEAERLRRPASEGAIAAWATARALAGDAAAGQSALEAVGAPESADVWMARALVRVASGDLAGSAEPLDALILRFPTAPIPVDWAEPAVGDAP